MSETRPSTVSSPPAGVSENGMAGTAERDAQEATTTDLDRILRERFPQYAKPAIEEVASGFRSVVDRRIAPIERGINELSSMKTDVQRLNHAVTVLLQQQQMASEGDLEPTEKEKRELQRQLAALQAQLTEATRTSHTYAAREQVFQACHELGVRWNDPDVDWHPDLHDRDPYLWASTVTKNLAAVARARQEKDAQTRFDQEREVLKRQIESTRDRQSVATKNEQQTEAARLFTPTVPETAVSHMPLDKLAKVTDPKERRRILDQMQRHIKRSGGAVELEELGRVV